MISLRCSKGLNALSTDVPRTMVLGLSCTLASPGVLIKVLMPGSYFRGSDDIGQGYGLGIGSFKPSQEVPMLHTSLRTTVQ